MPRANLLVASSNRGKIEEFRELAHLFGRDLRVGELPGFDRLPAFEEAAGTIAENAAGKAMYYSPASSELVLADDSGLVVPSLGGGPGVHSSRYAGPERDAKKNIARLLAAMAGMKDREREARFICVLAVARAGRVLAVISDAVSGTILDTPRGNGGFGYDPVFHYAPAGKTFAELAMEEKNRVSHRGRAVKKLAAYLEDSRP